MWYPAFLNVSQILVFVKAFHKKVKKKEKLTPNEKRLLGCLAQIEMTATTGGRDSISSITDIPSFPRVNKFTLVRPPIQYLHGTDPNLRTLHRHTKITQAWVGLIAGASFALAFVLDQVKKLGDVAKRQVSKAAGCCCTPEETIMLMTYCNLNGEQMKRIKRFTLWKWGWMVFSSWASVAKTNCKTAQSKTVTMQRPVKQTRNGENIMTRDAEVSVFTIRMMEHLVCKTQELLVSGKFKQRNGGPPGEMSSEHKGKIVVKISADAGGGSTKNMNLCNVANPQSQEHQQVCGEFSGIKDTNENIRRAWYHEGSVTKSDTENTLQRRSVVLTTRLGKKQDQLRAIVVINTSDDHDESKPSPIPI